MKRYSLLLCVIITFAVTLAVAQKPDFRFKHLSATDGLSHNFIRKVYQDHQRLMWFGSSDGLNMYDGNTVTVFKNDPENKNSLTSNEIYDIFEDSEHRFWIGTGKGLDLFQKDKQVFSHSKNLGDRYVGKIYQDKKKNVWLLSRNELYLFNQQIDDFEKFKIPDAKSELISMLEDSKGTIWMGCSDGVYTLDQANHRIIKQNTISLTSVTCIYEDSKNNLWFTSREQGVILYDRKTSRSINYTSGQDNIHPIASKNMMSVSEDALGRLWFGTENNGLFILDKGEIYGFSDNGSDTEGLSSNTVYSICRDRDNQMWLGTFSGGVEYVTNKKFSHFKKKVGDDHSLTHNNITYFYEDSKGIIWVGTDGGGLNIFNKEKGTFTHLKHDPKNPKSMGSDVVTYIMEDKSGYLWVGHWAGGLDRYDRNTNEFTHYIRDPNNPSETLSDNNIVELYEDSQSNFWVGTAYGLDKLDRKTGKFIHYNTHGNGLDGFIADILEDSQSNLWVATFDGLFILDTTDKTTTKFVYDKENKNTISSNLVMALFEDSHGNMWAGTGGGLNLYNRKNKSFSAFRKKDGLPSDAIYSMQEDKKGNLWISSSNGLSDFNPTTKKIKNYSFSDGLQGNIFRENSSIQLRSGEMLFGGTNGFNLFSPDQIQSNTNIPEVIITDFRIFNKVVPIGTEDSPLQTHISQQKKIMLTYKQSVFSFDFAALNYTSPEKNQYAYKLDGLETEWNYIGNKRSATYTTLKPGEYTFRVKASNNDGVWNEQGVALQIIVTPPFWKTWWFLTLVVLLIVSSALMYYKAKMSAIEAQKIKLEQQVSERTAEVVMQKEELQSHAKFLQLVNVDLQEKQEEIEQQRDNLERVNEHIMSSIQYAHTIQQAILPSQTRMQAAFQDHFVIFRPKDVVSGDFYWLSMLNLPAVGEQPESNLTFIAAVDCTGHGVPGAFMSMIGNTLLNEIVNVKKMIDPAQILDQLNLGVHNAVGKVDGVNTAGMDVAMCCLKKGQGSHVRVLFAGAKRPLLYVRRSQREVEKLEGDRKSIGSESKVQRLFITKELVLEAGDVIYLTSDGYADQNNPQRVKLGSSKVKELIAAAVRLPFMEQKALFDQALDHHMQGVDQRDDITFIGVQV